jgi:hypothetical protein
MMEIDPRIQRFLADTGLERETKVLPLTGDASDRQYFRVLMRSATSRLRCSRCTPARSTSRRFHS